MTWDGSAFVFHPTAVPLDSGSVPAWIRRLVVKVAHGAGPPEEPLSQAWLDNARRAGFTIHGWAWCDAETPAEVLNEAQYHAGEALRWNVSAFVANMEEEYDAHGNSSDRRYDWPAAYLDELRAAWTRPLGLTTTPQFGSDQTAWINAGAVTMPQAFPLENGATLSSCVSHAAAWGWPLAQIRPLLQAFTPRPDPYALNNEANALGIGGVPYLLEQAMGDDGRAWLESVKPTVVRPQPTAPPPEPEPEPVPEPTTTKIGKQHGITARLNWYRATFPELCARGPGWKQSDPGTWPWPEREWRTSMIEWAHHDGVQPEPSYVPPAP